MQKHLLVLDNYDSFTFNLVQMFRQYPIDVEVVRSDCITTLEVKEKSPDYVVISPGPKTPASAGISVELIRELHQHLPILGVCLGMQSINEAFGGKTVPAPRPVHGKTCLVNHTNHGVFSGIKSPFRAARYHSLSINDLSSALTVTAWSDDDVIMGIAHVSAPLFGVQFHPESFLTEHGFRLIENFLGPNLERIPPR